MGEGFFLNLPAGVYRDLRRHLIPPGARQEEAAFLFAHADGAAFKFVDWLPVPPEGFAHQSEFYIELTDEMRAGTIKRAHDLESSLIELHSHPFQQEARFSPSDRQGLLEFVPHVLWRLPGRPYAAVVMTPTNFDALVWIDDVAQSAPLRLRLDDGRVIEPTQATAAAWSRSHE